MTYPVERLSPTFKDKITCAACGQEADRTGPVQKYCAPCSEVANRNRRAKWAREHAVNAEDRGVWAAGRREQIQAAGVELSAKSRSSICWMGEDPPDMSWMVRATVPFDYALSKNHIWRVGRKGHVYLRQESNAARQALAFRLKSALGSQVVARNKLWVDIFVQKSNHKGDAANFVDSIFDAVKVAVGLDDRWFSLRRLDWEIIKKDPKIYVGIGQETAENVQVCSSCGRLLPYSWFSKNKNDKMTGHARTCRECLSSSREARKRYDKVNPRTVITIAKAEDMT